MTPTLYDDIATCTQPWLVVFVAISGFINPMTDQPLESGHANMLLINRNLKEIERFEPHGGETTVYNVNSMDAFFKNFADQLGYSYINPLDYCPLGPQSREAVDTEIRRLCVALGYCVAWATMYTLLRLLNPEYSREEVLADILNGTPKQLNLKSRRFTTFMDSVIPD